MIFNLSLLDIIIIGFCFTIGSSIAGFVVGTILGFVNGIFGD